MRMSSLPKAVTRKRTDRDSNPRPLWSRVNALPLSHTGHLIWWYQNQNDQYCLLGTVVYDHITTTTSVLTAYQVSLGYMVWQTGCVSRHPTNIIKSLTQPRKITYWSCPFFLDRYLHATSLMQHHCTSGVQWAKHLHCWCLNKVSP